MERWRSQENKQFSISKSGLTELGSNKGKLISYIVSKKYLFKILILGIK